MSLDSIPINVRIAICAELAYEAERAYEHAVGDAHPLLPWSAAHEGFRAIALGRVRSLLGGLLPSTPAIDAEARERVFDTVAVAAARRLGVPIAEDEDVPAPERAPDAEPPLPAPEARSEDVDWMTVRKVDAEPVEVTGYAREADARLAYERLSHGWTETFLVKVVAGPGEPRSRTAASRADRWRAYERWALDKLEASSSDARTRTARRWPLEGILILLRDAYLAGVDLEPQVVSFTEEGHAVVGFRLGTRETVLLAHPNETSCGLLYTVDSIDASSRRVWRHAHDLSREQALIIVLHLAGSTT